jgi:hypothetical protein
MMTAMTLRGRQHDGNIRLDECAADKDGRTSM